MAKYIDRDAFLSHERTWYCNQCDRRKNGKGKIVYEIGDAPCRACDIGDVLDLLEDYPAADVVERKKGKWKMAYLDHEAFGVRPHTFYCSECHQMTPFRTFFCPNCGADMRGDEH